MIDFDKGNEGRPPVMIKSADGIYKMVENKNIEFKPRYY